MENSEKDYRTLSLDELKALIFTCIECSDFYELLENPNITDIKSNPLIAEACVSTSYLNR